MIILGILAAIVIPQFTNASTNARASSVVSQLQTLRSQIQLFKLQHNDTLPDLVGTSPACWNQLMSKTNITGTVDTTAAGIYGPYLETDPQEPAEQQRRMCRRRGRRRRRPVGRTISTTGNIYATNQTADPGLRREHRHRAVNRRGSNGRRRDRHPPMPVRECLRDFPRRRDSALSCA